MPHLEPPSAIFNDPNLTPTTRSWLFEVYKHITENSNVVQTQYTIDGAVNTGTTTMPHDDTIPQKTEGDEYMTLSITPKDANNVLKIEVVAYLAHSVAGSGKVMALFQDDTTDALAAVVGAEDDANWAGPFILTHMMTAGTTNSTTFKVRAGHTSAGTTTFNGASGSRLMGGVLASSIIITEYIHNA